MSILGGIAAGISIYQGVSSIFGGKSQQDLGQQQNQLAMQQAQQNYDLGQQYNESQAMAAQGLYDAMHGSAAGMYWAAQQAGEAAEKNAQRIEKEGGEVVRRTKLDHRQTEAMAKARQAASGIDITRGSAKNFRDEQNKENKLERVNIQEAYASQAEVARQQGQVQMAELHAAAAGATAGADSVLLQQMSEAAAVTLQGQQGMASAGLVGKEYQAQGTSNIFSGIGSVASGIGGLFGAFGGGGGSSSGGGGGGGNIAGAAGFLGSSAWGAFG